MELTAEKFSLVSDGTATRKALPFSALYTLCLLLAGNFLAFDLLRRLSSGLEPRNFAVLLANLTIVWAAASILCLGAALLLRLLETGKPGLSQPVLVFCLYSINLTFGKYWASGWFEPLSADIRFWVSMLALALAIPFGLLARDSLSVLRDLVLAGGRRLALALTLPVLGILLLPLSGREPGTVTGEAQAPKKPDVLLLTIDTLSAADMSVYGYARPTTPELEKFARGAVLFERAHSASNLTEMALCAFEGFYARSRQDGDTLLSQLRAAGYRDNLFVSFNTPEFFGLQRPELVRVVSASEDTALYRGLSRIVPPESMAWFALILNEEWNYFCPYDWRVGAEYHRYWKREHFSEELAYQSVLEHLARQRSAPSFVWLHLWQPHYPYLPGPGFKGRFGSHPLLYPPVSGTPYLPGLEPMVEDLRRSYDEYIAELDAGLGVFLGQLETQGILDHTILVISADHGEQLEQGYAGHGGYSLSEPMTHIPMILRFPRTSVGTRVASFVSPVDVAPTILGELGLRVPESLPGEALQPYIQDPQKLSLRPKVSISADAYSKEIGEVAVFSDRFKVVFRREDPQQVEVYDLIADPRETTDIRQRFGSAVDAVVKSVQWPAAQPAAAAP